MFKGILSFLGIKKAPENPPALKASVASVSTSRRGTSSSFRTTETFAIFQDDLVARVMLIGDSVDGKQIVWNALTAGKSVSELTKSEVSRDGFTSLHDSDFSGKLSNTETGKIISQDISDDKACVVLDYFTALSCDMSEDFQDQITKTHGFILVNDYTSLESVQKIADWINWCKKFNPDASIFLVGLKTGVSNSETELRIDATLEQVKKEFLMFNSYTITKEYQKSITTSMRAALRMILHQAKHVITEQRKKQYFKPLEEEDGWEFK